jgi:RHS repeat-associated protein
MGMPMTHPAVCASEVLFPRSRSTGKERDAESGNDYFGARYYASSMGRFLSPDWSAKVEPVPYAKLADPQTLNLYAYVGNNPLIRLDADGHYVCDGDKKQCAQLSSALAAIQTAVNSGKLTDGETSKLNKVLSFYGQDEGKGSKDTKVFVGFSESGGSSTTLHAGKVVNVTLDFKNGLHGKSAEAERAGTTGHEGIHGVRKQNEGNPLNRSEEMNREEEGYQVQGSINKGLGMNSAYGIWTQNDGYNQEKIDHYAGESTDKWCQQFGGSCN